MKKNKSFSFAILSLIVIAFMVTYVSISSYISMVSSNLSKSSSVVSQNYETFKTVALNNMDASINMATSTLVYLSTIGDDLTKLNNSKIITDFSCARLEQQRNAITPCSMEFFTREDVDNIINGTTEYGDIYTAFSQITSDEKKTVLFYCEENSSSNGDKGTEYFNQTGYYLLTMCSEKSSYYICCGYFTPSYFLQKTKYSDVITSGSYALYSSEHNVFYSFDFSTNEIHQFAYTDIDNAYEITSKTTNNRSKIAEYIESSLKWELDIKNMEDDREFHMFFEPIKLTNCSSINLYVLITLPNSSGINNNLVTIVNDKGNSTTLLILLIFIVIGVITLFLQFNYQKNQNKFNEKLEIETKRYLSIIDFAKWLLWEYNFSTNEITFLSEADSTPFIIEQYKSRIITENTIISEDMSLFDELIEHIRAGERGFSKQIRIKYNSPDYRWYEFTGHTIFDTSGKPVTAQIVAIDIDEQKKQLDEIKSSAERDPLTGIYNLGAFRERVRRTIADTPSSLMHAFILVDFDDFSSINENYGRTFGDVILIEFTSKISPVLGAKDLIGRVGSDKFIIFLHSIPDTNYATNFASQILSMNFFDNITLTEDKQWKLTSSIGVALYPNHGESFEELIGAVDIALYHAKMNGRNCCVTYDNSFASTNTGHDLLLSLNKDIGHSPNNIVIDNDLVYNVFDLLFSTHDINMSLPMTMSLIGNHYNLDQVGLIEFSEDGTIASCNYSWNSKNFERFAKNITNLDIEIDRTFHLFEQSETNCYYTNKLDLHNIPQTVITDIVKCSSIQSIFQCAITNNNKVMGYLFAHSVNIIDWVGCISDTIEMISRLITTSILRQHSEDDINKLIKTDILTGSNNLSSFVTKGTALLDSNPYSQFAMIYMDINKFKLINDKYGYSVGDKVIIHLSEIIAQHLEDDELYARADADKFLLMIHFNGISVFDKRLLEIFNSFTQKIKDEIGYRASLIAGVYLIQDHNDCNISSALDKANIARKSIKDHHNTTYEIFNDAMQKSIIIKNEIENSMEAALENNEFVVYYQPKTNIYENKICGSEALVRWNRPGSGLMSPALFIPVFEENGFIVNVDYYVFERVCETLRRLIDKGTKVYPVSVNFSRVHLKNDKILSFLESTTKKYDINPSLVEIEITESALSEGDDFTPTILNAIKNLGFKLSMDDFGCGLSSLNSLRKFPFDILKLDKEFFNKDGIQEKDQIVVRNVVTLAQQLNMALIAEGIETIEQVEFLRTIDCPVVQGYVYSPPIPEDEFIKKYLTEKI